jgi:Zn-dependent protease with chaperone function
MAMAAYGAGSTIGVLLPFSRKHELEADRYG